MRVALVGNPNSGKTTLFNALTGSNQYVGNWPGVTVEKKGGKLKDDKSVEITDLPGIYSLSPYTLEEVIARNFLMDENPDAIINIVDGTNLERNLYLTTQLLELGIPVIVAINMMDAVHKRGDEININVLEEKLGCPVVEISALKNEGIDTVVNCLKTIPETLAIKPISFSREIEDAIVEVRERLVGGCNERFAEMKDASEDLLPDHLLRFFSIKLLENDQQLRDTLKNPPVVYDEIVRLEKHYNDDVESVITDERYKWITSVMPEVRKLGNEGKLSTSEKIDKVVTNRILALPIFAVIMFLVYYLAVTAVGTPCADFINDNFFGEDGWYIGAGQEQFDEANDAWEEADSIIAAYTEAAEDAGLDPENENFLAEAEDTGLVGMYDVYDDETGENEVVEVDAAAYAEAQEVVAEMGEAPDPADFGFWVPGLMVVLGNLLDAIDAADWLKGLILDGIVSGVGSVLSFIPQLLVLFLMLAFLESCGYMSRIAFILDRVFRRFGLSGKSFVPMLIGTGCGVPGVMASRTIESQADRRLTVMTTTFIPCSAKLPIIALFAGAVFGGLWWVAPSAYFLGIAAILCTGIIMKKTRMFAGDASPFIMELPAYHMPTVGAVLRSMWERAWSFIKKAGTIILLAVIVIWFISSFGLVDGAFGMVEDTNESILAVLGGAICWIFNPLGWGDWQAASAAVTGLIAKENVVGTLGVLYAGGEGWYNNVQLVFTPLMAYSFLAFNLLCAPCFAAMGAIKREMNNRKWFWAAIGYQCGFAWMVALWIYQIGGIVSGTVAFGPFTILALITAAIFLFLLFRPNPQKRQGQGDPEGSARRVVVAN